MLVIQVGESVMCFLSIARFELIFFFFFFECELELARSYRVMTDTSVVLVFACFGHVMTRITEI